MGVRADTVMMMMMTRPDGMELMLDAGQQNNALGPAAPAKWELKAELDEIAAAVCGLWMPIRSRSNLSWPPRHSLHKTGNESSLAMCRSVSKAPHSLKPADGVFFSARNRQYSIECHGLLGLAAASRFPEFDGEWSLQWPPCELFAPTAGVPIQLPAGTLQLSGGKDLPDVKTASEVDAPRMELAKTVLELPGLASLRFSGLQVKLPPSGCAPPAERAGRWPGLRCD